MKEYFNNPQVTAKVMDEDGWFYTADLASKDHRGYIYIAGRSSEMYKSGGENIYPREIEDLLESHPAVLFAAVINVPDDVFQEVGWAFVMTIPGQETTEDRSPRYTPVGPFVPRPQSPDFLLHRPLFRSGQSLPLFPTCVGEDGSSP